MPLYLVGLNIDSPTAHYRVEREYLVQLMRGIYVAAADDADAIVLQHAVRIAKYLYPKAYLAAASAILLGPTADGRLFLSSKRIQRTRIRALEIIQNQAPSNPSLAPAVVQDPIGEITVDVSSLRQRFLETFRLRSEHAASISDARKQELVQRLIAEYGSSSQAAEAVWALARANQWYREAEQAEKWLTRQPPIPVVTTETSVDLHVVWHGVPLGRLRHDGFEWRWTPDKVDMPSPVRGTVPGKLPPFIGALLPEGWLEEILQSRSERDMLLSGRRYMSNIVIVDDLAKLSVIPADVLDGRLANWTREGRFTGSYEGPGRERLADGFERAVAELYKHVDTPRLSGIQIKAPMFLDATGRLLDAKGRPFTHILKPASTAGFEALPIVEWTALQLAAAAGFVIPAHALVEVLENLPPALVVERFDIRRGPEDRELYCLEDFCSILDVSTEAKYHSTIERVAKALRSVSTEPDADLLILFRRALFAWLIADGDMHLKNMAVLKTAMPGDKTFRSVRFTPIYDVVTTRVFPRLAQDRMALKLNGKDDQLRRNDFLTLARTIGLKASMAQQALDDMREGLRTAIAGLQLAKLATHGPNGLERIDQLREIVNARCTSPW
ncbi:MAG: type II toxin-antitoxin system HipA family toxin [Pseudomonadota bacterium]